MRGHLFLSYDAEQQYMVFHYFEIHETDSFLTKLHRADVKVCGSYRK